MALHYQNPNQQHLFNPFEHQDFHFQDTNDIFVPPLENESELLCFDDPFSPTTLFHFDDPSFDHVQLPPFDDFHHDQGRTQKIELEGANKWCTNNIREVDFESWGRVSDSPPCSFIPDHDHHDFITPNIINTTPFEYVEFPPPMLHDYTQYYPKKQKIESFPPCYIPNIFTVPEFNHEFRFDTGVLMKEEQFNPFNGHHFEFSNGGLAEFNEGYGENVNDDNKVKVKVISPQSKAARERRRKISMKTHELGKLIPGGSKMNTAEMFQAGYNYVKFMQAQLGILESIKTMQKDDCDIEANLNNNLSILSSKLVQEKLLAKEQCLVPLDVLPVLEEHCNMETKPSISEFIKELIR